MWEIPCISLSLFDNSNPCLYILAAPINFNNLPQGGSGGGGGGAGGGGGGGSGGGGGGGGGDAPPPVPPLPQAPVPPSKMQTIDEIWAIPSKTSISKYIIESIHV